MVDDAKVVDSDSGGEGSSTYVRYIHTNKSIKKEKHFIRLDFFLFVVSIGERKNVELVIFVPGYLILLQYKDVDIIKADSFSSMLLSISLIDNLNMENFFLLEK